MDNVSKAVQYYEKGYMCSQAVFAAFAEQFGITEKQALQIGACFGGGMNKGEVCGACTGALMVLGMKYGQFDILDTEMSMPALVINEKLVSSGKTLKPAEIIELIKAVKN